MTVHVEMSEVQGNVLYAYGLTFPHAVHTLLAIRDVGAARSVLTGWMRQVTFGRRPSELNRAPHVNLAFTYAGLSALEVPAHLLLEFPEDFRDGAAQRSYEWAGDRGPNEASRWEAGFGSAHVLLSVYGTSADQARGCSEELLVAALGALEVLASIPAGLLDPSGVPLAQSSDVSCSTHALREHFGFADGCSQPAIEGVDDNPAGDGLYARVAVKGRLRQFRQEAATGRRVKRTWRLIKPGEFLLGYEDEDGVRPPGPPAPLGPNGTFMVLRKLEQDVAYFHEYLDEQVERLQPMSREELSARIIGRWPDGTPLALSSSEPDSTIAHNRVRANDFVYADDPHGHKCPLGSHVRRTNPRDSLPAGAEGTMRHRMIRRGMPYGARTDAEKGLLFICYASSIAQGFETVQREWCYGGVPFGLGAEPDVLLQQGEPAARMTVTVADGTARILSPPDRPFVTVRGGEYLFVPARRACDWLSNLFAGAAL
jgi:Dyp-type peroxidase family